MEHILDAAAVGLLAAAVLAFYLIVPGVLPVLSMDEQMFFLDDRSNFRSRRFNQVLKNAWNAHVRSYPHSRKRF